MGEQLRFNRDANSAYAFGKLFLYAAKTGTRIEQFTAAVPRSTIPHYRDSTRPNDEGYSDCAIRREPTDMIRFTPTASARIKRKIEVEKKRGAETFVARERRRRNAVRRLVKRENPQTEYVSPFLPEEEVAARFELYNRRVTDYLGPNVGPNRRSYPRRQRR